METRSANKLGISSDVVLSSSLAYRLRAQVFNQHSSVRSENRSQTSRSEIQPADCKGYQTMSKEGILKLPQSLDCSHFVKKTDT